jgi:hypothetical protein
MTYEDLCNLILAVLIGGGARNPVMRDFLDTAIRATHGDADVMQYRAAIQMTNAEPYVEIRHESYEVIVHLPPGRMRGMVPSEMHAHA